MSDNLVVEVVTGAVYLTKIRVRDGAEKYGVCIEGGVPEDRVQAIGNAIYKNNDFRVAEMAPYVRRSLEDFYDAR